MLLNWFTSGLILGALLAGIGFFVLVLSRSKRVGWALVVIGVVIFVVVLLLTLLGVIVR